MGLTPKASTSRVDHGADGQLRRGLSVRAFNAVLPFGIAEKMPHSVQIEIEPHPVHR